MVDVLQVVGYLFVDAQVVAAVGLRQTGDAGADAVAAALVGGHVFVVVGHPWAWADERHLAADDVDELGQFVQREAAEDFARSGHAVLCRTVVDVVVGGHGAEFHAHEVVAAQTGASLAVKHGAARVKFDDNGDDSEHWREQDEQDCAAY